jgi:dihydropyrimidinase
VTAGDDYQADVYCEDGVGRGHRPRPAGPPVRGRSHHRRLGPVRHAGRHRRAHPPQHAVRRADDFESGTIAAAFGGTTSIVDFAIQYRGRTMRHALDDWRKRAEDPDVFMVDDQTIFRALKRTGENGGLVCMHAENGGVIDELVKEALRRGAEVSCPHPPAPGRKGGDQPGDRAGRDGRRPHRHRSSLGGRRTRAGDTGATWGCPPMPRPARSTCF